MNERSRPRYYTLDPVTKETTPTAMLNWAREFENFDVRRVANDHFENDSGDYIRVSTVFLGMDHAWTGPPCIFETMVFSNYSKLDSEQERYATWEQAVAGHKALLRRAHRSMTRKGGKWTRRQESEAVQDADSEPPVTK